MKFEVEFEVLDTLNFHRIHMSDVMKSKVEKMLQSNLGFVYLQTHTPPHVIGLKPCGILKY